MWRDPAWLQRGLDVLKATLDVEPALKQQMIDFLLAEGFWDESRLTPAAARTRFNACMNPGKPDFFKLSELWALMKRFRRYELLFAMCEDMGFERPRPIPARARRAEIEKQLDSLKDQHAEQVAELELLLAYIGQDDGAEHVHDERPARIHPTMREPGARFALEDADEDGTARGGF